MSAIKLDWPRNCENQTKQLNEIEPFGKLQRKNGFQPWFGLVYLTQHFCQTVKLLSKTSHTNQPIDQ